MSTLETTDSDPRLAEHFHDVGHQHHSAVLGMWSFLATEVMFFSGLFAAYLVFRIQDPSGFATSSAQLDLWMGTFNTAVLLTSSWMVVLGIHAVQHDRLRRGAAYLAGTAGLGLFFLGVKAFEYAAKYDHGLIPGALWHPHGKAEGASELFFFIYFVMTGLHGLHVLIGVGLLLWVAWGVRRGQHDSHEHSRVECVGLYWHLVDLVWIYLFPLLYLIGVKAS